MGGVEYTYTGGMDEATAVERLRAADHGVLALAADGEAYAIPVGHHYDAETGRVLFRLTSHDDGARKLAAADATTSACFVVYGVEGERESWSVIVEGPVAELSADEQADYDAAALNEAFLPFRVFDESPEAIEYHLYAITPTSVTGRETLD